MILPKQSKCLLCDSSNNQPSFPYNVVFGKSKFHYLFCNDCSCVFIDPIPSDKDFANMYQNENYHEEHYVDIDLSEYITSAKLLSKLASSTNTRVLDYGCGYGHFLKALSLEGFHGEGLEFDKAACLKAETYSGCRVREASALDNIEQEKFDVIHLGDVLEHLPDPKAIMQQLIKKLSPDGLIFIEGPIESNPSPVFWAAKTFGLIKKIFFRRENPGKPTHLIRVNAKTQLNFIMEINNNIECLHWEVYETGWPYLNSGFLKNIIASMAIRLGGMRVFSQIMGNRFRGVFRVTQNQRTNNIL